MTRIGRYEAICEVARGGMATIYLGRAVGAGGFERLFAMKAMHPNIASEPDFVAMFLDEARLAARIRHPNVVPTLDIVDTDKGPVLIMEFVEGPTVHQILRRLRGEGRRIPLSISLRMFLDALAGLEAAHDLTGPDGASLQLVHRDFSPQNMLVGVDGVTRIADFGVARAEMRLQSTRGSQLKGKIAYMAPEQIAGIEIDRRCDLYAAAVVLWELLVGRRRFEADNEAALVAAIASAERRSPRDVDPTIPGPIADVCTTGLAKLPPHRFQTAGAFSEALEEAAHRSQTPIASRKAVVAYVREVAVHRSLAELVSGKTSSVLEPTPIVAPGRDGSGSGPIVASGASAGALQSSSTNIRAFLSRPPPSSRRSIGLVVAASLGGLLLGGLLWRTSSEESSPDATTASTPQGDPAQGPAAGPPIVAPPGAPAAASTTVTPAAPLDEPAPTPAAAKPPPSKPSAKPAKPAAALPPKPPAPPKAPAPKPSASAFNTMDL